MTEKDFAFILCSDRAYLVETQQDLTLIVLGVTETWRKAIIALESLYAN